MKGLSTFEILQNKTRSHIQPLSHPPIVHQKPLSVFHFAPSPSLSFFASPFFPAAPFKKRANSSLIHAAIAFVFVYEPRQLPSNYNFRERINCPGRRRRKTACFWCCKQAVCGNATTFRRRLHPPTSNVDVVAPLWSTPHPPVTPLVFSTSCFQSIQSGCHTKTGVCGLFVFAGTAGCGICPLPLQQHLSYCSGVTRLLHSKIFVILFQSGKSWELLE